MVVNSKIAGNDENSSGLVMPMATKITMRLIRMLNVNKMSKSQAGRGSTSMLMMSSTSAGTPRPDASKREMFCRMFDRLKSAIFSLINL